MAEGENRKSNSRRGSFAREGLEFKAGFPALDFPKDAKIGIKRIAYLHVYCSETPQEIAARYPRALTLADVHLALALYYRNRSQIDEEIERERGFNVRDSLGSPSMTLPRVGLQSLVETASEEVSPSVPLEKSRCRATVLADRSEGAPVSIR
jgi:hypothetical protein